MKTVFTRTVSIVVIGLSVAAIAGCGGSSASGTAVSAGASVSGGVPGNRPPVISGSPTSHITEGVSYSFKPNASDPDGDHLEFSIVNRPGWANFDTNMGTLSGTPAREDLGVFVDIGISVSDGKSTATLPEFSITVVRAGAAQVYFVAPLSTSCIPASPGSGTLANPWTNLYFALTQGGLRPGDTVQLRGGTYQNIYQGFMSDGSTHERWLACDDDAQSPGTASGDGSHTVLPLFLSGTAEQEIVIENFPGETVIIDGSNARLSSASWRQCGAGTYVTSDFNVGSARTPQIWVDPTGATDPGVRLRWNSDGSGSCVLSPGQFAVGNGGRDIYVRLPDGSTPAGHDLHMSCQAGDCAPHPVHADEGAQYITVRRNPAGGRFAVKYGYYNAYITRGAHHLTFDGIDWVAGGGRDYGYCFRVHDGDFVTVRNGLCRESMAEGIGLYGGGPTTGIQISNVIVENMEIYDTGRGWVDGGGIGTSLGMGVILKNCRDCVVRGSTIHGSYRSGIQVNHSSGGCPTAACDSSNALIEGNEIWDFCRHRTGSDMNAGQTDCGAILLRHDQSNGLIDGGVIRNNMIYGNLSLPFSNNAAPSGIYTDGDIPNVKIRNNSLNDIPGACINVDPNQRSVTIMGNAMDNCSASGGGCSGGGCALFTDAGTQHLTRYNTYWAQSGSTPVIQRRSSVGISRDQVTSAWESTAVQVSPGFMSQTDLRIRSTSGLIDVQPCIDAPPIDFNELSRPQGVACDIGAYEQ